MIFECPLLSQAELEVIDQVGDLREKLRYAIRNTPRRWTGVLRRNTFARAIQGSNSIEGYNVTYEDAIAAVDNEEPLDASQEAWEAVRGYRDAMTYVLQLADDKYFKFNEELIKSLHFMMIKYDISKHPGRWRAGYICVRSEPSGDIVYEGPDVDILQALIAELIKSLNDPNDYPVMVRAAMAHLNLVMIHPFSDGNGRMARALQTLVLSREGIVSPEFSSIEEYLGRNTLDYYNVLALVGQGQWNPQNDAMPWVRFCLTAHFRQAETILRRLREYEKLYESLTELVSRLSLPDRYVWALFDAANGLKVRNSSYRKAVEISDDAAGRDLKALSEMGLLLPHGEKRGRFYIAGPDLVATRRKIREPRSEQNPFKVSDQPMLPGLLLGR